MNTMRMMIQHTGREGTPHLHMAACKMVHNWAWQSRTPAKLLRALVSFEQELGLNCNAENEGNPRVRRMLR